MVVQTLRGRPWWQAAQHLCTFHSTCPVGCFSDTDLGKLGTELLTRASASPPAAGVAALLTAARRQHRGRFLLLLSAVALVWLPGHFHLCHQEGCLLGRRRAGPRHGHRGFPGRGGRTCAWGASGRWAGLSAGHSGMRHRPCGSWPVEHLGAQPARWRGTSGLLCAMFLA